MKSLSHVQLSATLWTIGWQAPVFMGFSRQEYLSAPPFPSPNSAGQLQHNPWWSVCSLSLSNSAYGVFTRAPWNCPKESQPRWWVCGRSLEGSQRRSPKTSPPLTPQLSSGALPGFTRITRESQCPHLTSPQVPRAQVRHGSREPCEDSPAGFRVLWPRLSPGSERFATKSVGCFSPRQDPWPLQLPEPWGSRELEVG